MRYGSQRHPARDPAVPPPTGPVIGGNGVPVTVTVFEGDPIVGGWLRRLFVSATLVSPMASGRFRPGDKGARQNRDTRDIGPLQNLNGGALIGRAMLSRLGAQGGPSSQPAFPSTGSTEAPSIRHALAGMDLPQILRT